MAGRDREAERRKPTARRAEALTLQGVRRPSHPAFLFLAAATWITTGIIALRP
jgi:hypothetical protein